VTAGTFCVHRSLPYHSILDSLKQQLRAVVDVCDTELRQTLDENALDFGFMDRQGFGLLGILNLMSPYLEQIIDLFVVDLQKRAKDADAL
jgi:hypothetical protein